MAQAFRFRQLEPMPRRATRVQERWRACAIFAVVLVLSACAKATGDTQLAVVGRPSQQAQPSLQTGDGYIPEGQSISPFDSANPAISNLDPDLRSAMQHAAEDARRDGINFRVNSDYGLCQTYANEMWHFELSTTAGGTCSAMITDASAG
jgi:hypothetical protein